MRDLFTMLCFFHFQAELQEFKEMRRDQGERESEIGGILSDGEDED